MAFFEAIEGGGLLGGGGGLGAPFTMVTENERERKKQGKIRA